VMQFILGIGMLIIGAVSERRELPLFWTLLAVLSVMHATHDIACDGYYLLGLDEKGQALYVGIRVAAFYLARVVGSGALVYLAGRTDWRFGFGAAGVIMIVVSLVNSRFLPHPPEPSPKHDTVGTSARIWERIKTSNAFASYKTFFSQPQAALVLSFMFLYKLGDIMMFAMGSPLLRDIGVDTAHRGILRGIGQVVFIVISMAMGALIAKIGLRRSLIPMLYIQNFSIPLYILLATLQPPSFWVTAINITEPVASSIGGTALPLYVQQAALNPRFLLVTAVYIIEQTASAIGATALTVFLMQRTKRAFSASHYAFATALAALGSTLSGAFSGNIDAAVGHTWYFTLAFLLSIPSLVIVLFVPRDPIEKPA